jgi:hypothetical protein
MEILLDSLLIIGFFVPLGSGYLTKRMFGNRRFESCRHHKILIIGKYNHCYNVANARARII